MDIEITVRYTTDGIDGSRVFEKKHYRAVTLMLFTIPGLWHSKATEVSAQTPYYTSIHKKTALLGENDMTITFDQQWVKISICRDNSVSVAKMHILS